ICTTKSHERSDLRFRFSENNSKHSCIGTARAFPLSARLLESDSRMPAISCKLVCRQVLPLLFCIGLALAQDNRYSVTTPVPILKQIN
ncbi:unnamed protein product, partial [Heterotrigona itama]